MEPRLERNKIVSTAVSFQNEVKLF